MPERSRSQNLRKGRHSESGRIYHIRLACHSRERIFADVLRGREVVNVMRTLQEEVDTLCYVVMPDHVHWLMNLKGGELSLVVQKLKSLVTRRLHDKNAPVGAGPAREGAIWQSGFYDRAIRRDEDVQAVARYIVANPLRSGLVRSLRDYPLWDAVWL